MADARQPPRLVWAVTSGDSPHPHPHVISEEGGQVSTPTTKLHRASFPPLSPPPPSPMPLLPPRHAVPSEHARKVREDHAKCSSLAVIVRTSLAVQAVLMVSSSSNAAPPSATLLWASPARIPIPALRTVPLARVPSRSAISRWRRASSVPSGLGVLPRYCCGDGNGSGPGPAIASSGSAPADDDTGVAKPTGASRGERACGNWMAGAVPSVEFPVAVAPADGVPVHTGTCSGDVSD